MLIALITGSLLCLSGSTPRGDAPLHQLDPIARRLGPHPRMLRNIDSCEAIIFTRDAAVDRASGSLRAGVARLIDEAREQGTLVAVLKPSDRDRADASKLADCFHWPLREQEPSIVELNELRVALNVENPEGFGGSDGFGQAPGAAYGREPIAAYCVVLVTTLTETIAAMGAGMRSIAIPALEGDWVDEELDGIADICLDGIGGDSDPLALRVGDMSTPGAYWLNPPLPRDIHGMMVDPSTGELLKGGATQQAAAVGEAPPPPPAPLPLPSPRAHMPSSAPRRSTPPRAMATAEVPPPSEVPPLDAAVRMREEGAALIDVRQPAEFRLDGHVEGSDNIPAYTWEHGFYLPSEGFADEVAAAYAPDAPLLLLCGDGSLSSGAAAVLEAASFTNVQTVAGGLTAWSAGAEEEGADLPAVLIDEDGEGGLTGAWV